VLNPCAIIGRRGRPGLSENLSARESIPCFFYFLFLSPSFILLIYGDIED